MAVATEPTIEITAQALEQILALREAETIPDLHLGIAIVGVGANGFLYETAFLRPDDVPEGDHVEDHSGLPVVIPQDSLESLAGAVLDLGGDPQTPGLVLRNPNVPSPAIGNGDIELTGSVEERVSQLLAEHINPSIAAHGGVASLAGVDGAAAYLELGGGCQGCGLAAMTLRQGIEKAILENIPEITEVVDVTDHAAGDHPFYS
jgi:Fe/S biogenesis protein NfuA